MYGECVSENARLYKESTIVCCEKYVAGAQKRLNNVENIHAMILRQKELHADDKSKRRSLLRLSRSCVKDARKGLAEAKTEYERVVGLPVSEFE